MENENRVYLKYLVDKNVGPLTDVRIDFPFSSEGNPKPVILVGENGTGKSTILSNIVDAFFEMAGKIYSNACKSGENHSHLYFKAIFPAETHLGTSFMYSVISFFHPKNLNYIFKSGDLSFQDFRVQLGKNILLEPWDAVSNVKNVFGDEKAISDIWKNNVLCYFGPDRYEKPAWMVDNYYQKDEFLHPNMKKRWGDTLLNPIIAQGVTLANLQWILDVIADSRAEIVNENGNILLDCNNDIDDLRNLRKTRDNLESILSKIIGEDVYLQMNYRNRGGTRIIIVRKSDNCILCPTLDSLSTGQIALFNLFATIVRYADNDDLEKSFHLEDITGIVVIDEIELHLHSKLQKEILPQLIKLFPRVQFVITSHSPLFLLGMRDTFGEDGFEVYEMPDAEKINTERFVEFQQAYEYLKQTETFQQDLKDALEAITPNSKAIIITEGSTDWKHLKAALENLRSSGLHHELFDNLNIEFFEYESAENKDKASKLEMGGAALHKLCQYTSKLPKHVKHIFIADSDDDDIKHKMSSPERNFKNWGNNVYSFVLPVPPHRSQTPKICIEHYYTDNEIKTEWIDPETKVARRLYIGNEFDERGLALSIDKICEGKNKCGNSSIAIIDGCSNEKVTCISNDTGINYALPKSKFAKMILEKQEPFDKFNFESFIPIFEIIKDIINDNQETAHA